MCAAMAHRGPDDAGVWTDAAAEIGLGHRRLSILDLSPAGHQPMANHDGSLWISYNGEVYNFAEHRERLLAAGRSFRSHTDTEVLLALYEERGIDFLDALNGMFAFALWDARRRRLLLARDHAGIKPLYYWRDGRRLYFASEIKALLAIPEIPRKLHLPSIGSYLHSLWVPGEETLLEGVKKLEPGHLLLWQDGEVTTRRWFSLAWEPDESRSEAQWVEDVHDTFMRTTRRQMVSDVPLGAFLSGGLDSSSIVACMRQSFPARDITAYTVRFETDEMAREMGVEDYPYACEVAERLGVHLKSVVLRPDVIRLLPRMVYFLDEPDADESIFPSYLISKLAREDGTTVLLSGTGGDEVFFGYRSHQAVAQYRRLAWLAHPPASTALSAAGSLATSWLGAGAPLARRLVKFQRGLVEQGLARHMALYDWSSPEVRSSLYSPALRSAVAPNPIPACMERYRDAFVGRGEINLHSHLLIQTFLAAHNFLYTDKTSMAVSLETRVPFLDVELLRLAARIPERHKLRGRQTKYVLKQAMKRYLPERLVRRPKVGFGAPLRHWVRKDLAEVIRALLSPERIEARGLFDARVLQTVLAENDAGRVDHAHLLYALLNLELWMQTFLDRPGVEVSL
jgi:asparagine synthase (glutamine-hydrolysing)